MQWTSGTGFLLKFALLLAVCGSCSSVDLDDVRRDDLDYNVKLEMYGIIQKEYAKMVFRQEACEDKIKSFVESCNACPSQSPQVIEERDLLGAILEKLKAKSDRLIKDLKKFRDKILKGLEGFLKKATDKAKNLLKKVIDFFKKKIFPKLKLPKIKLPKIKLPKIKLPKIKLPKIKLPKIKLPKIKIKLPKIKLPKIKLPKLKWPKIKIPKIKLSKISLKKLFRGKHGSSFDCQRCEQLQHDSEVGTLNKVCGSDFSRKLEENQKMLGKLSDLERAMISGSNFIVKVTFQEIPPSIAKITNVEYQIPGNSIVFKYLAAGENINLMDWEQTPKTLAPKLFDDYVFS
ncbi:uncharacterized protein LOC125671569 isoform X2 [Ostrea edulis]|nr:uncharacterized protein LOC125671569 isoform X2 [Ostrea edulis]